ncbi:Origin recognition subunit [Plasmodium coatneyi]|uniref:Origin recognition subunit n=1 Tax=Plasmodium coatneyi TaxID=208452 RepID=A0A1B1DSF7_9APIC|nr:Origin recognition subunit [Plasmodium coatneyi]ANQ05718.1 Origin recognition subunit [Plasmodium coatneyi]
MMQSIQVNSPKKVVRMQGGSDEDEENEKEEYLITNLTENNKNMPSLIVRIPSNMNKFLSKEEVKINFNEDIKLPNKKGSKKLRSFKMEPSPTGSCEQVTEKTTENTYGSSDVKVDSTYQSDGTDGGVTPRNGLLPERGSGESDDDRYDEGDNDDDDEMSEGLIKSFKQNYVEKHQTDPYNESVAFLREHTKNELEYFLQKKKLHSSYEMNINDIINIDYDKLNEKNIIPYFLTNMFDAEQKKKREKLKQLLEDKRKSMMERSKRRHNKHMDKGIAARQKGKRRRSSKGRTPTKGEKIHSAKLKREKGAGANGKVDQEDDDADDENEDGDEDDPDGEDISDSKGHSDRGDDSGKNKQGAKLVGVKDKRTRTEEDPYLDDFDKDADVDADVNIYNDPTLYGIEGSSDYSEGLKSDVENSQEDEEAKDQQQMGNISKTQKKKKKNADDLAEDEEKIDDIIDTETQKLISYDYYSSVNIKEVVKPSYKIKSLTPFIPIEENIDNLDHVQKLQYLIKNLPHTHIKEKRSLYHYNIKQFIKWKVYLMNNINICLYGVGSKYHVLNLFCNICLNDGNKCIVLGFEEEINFEEIITRILEYHYKYKTSKNLKSFDLLYELIHKVNETNLPLYFVIHNIDNVKLYPYYEYFSFMSQYDNIHFVCSIDDVSFELNMNFKNISSINFHYVKCHTWLDYRHEILRQWNKFLPEWVFNKKCEEVDVKKNIETILNALSINHKRLFKIIASIQLENLEKGIYGVEKESLLQDKRIFTVGASSIRINSLLVEFVSHNVITETRLKEGNTFLKINADKEELKRVAEQL